jgi:hypothetical protein
MSAPEITTANAVKFRVALATTRMRQSGQLRPV